MRSGIFSIINVFEGIRIRMDSLSLDVKEVPDYIKRKREEEEAAKYEQLKKKSK
jgi:hypothetical protein